MHHVQSRIVLYFVNNYKHTGPLVLSWFDVVEESDYCFAYVAIGYDTCESTSV
jgi:hypothetical protein